MKEIQKGDSIMLKGFDSQEYVISDIVFIVDKIDDEQWGEVTLRITPSHTEKELTC